MPKTTTDMQKKVRIMNLIENFKDKTDKEMIYMIAGMCGVSHRTASEHFHAYKAQKTLRESGFVEKCEHDWSNYFCTPGGLAKECRICGRTEFGKVE